VYGIFLYQTKKIKKYIEIGYAGNWNKNNLNLFKIYDKMSFFQVKKLKKQTNNKMMYIKNTLNKKKWEGHGLLIHQTYKKAWIVC
jgi:hypothetical protein